MALSVDAKRDLLRKVMKERGLKTAEWAKNAGVDKNSLYNFLNGHSQSLSLTTYSKLALSVKLSISELTGDMAEERKPWTILVEGCVEGGKFYMPGERPRLEYYIDVPVSSEYEGKARGLEVSDTSGGAFYPKQSIVVWVASRDIRPARNGDHVVVESIAHDGKSETSIREMRVIDGEVWLSSLSDHPAHQSALSMSNLPEHIRTVEISGLIIGSYVARQI